MYALQLLCASEARTGGAAGPSTRANMAVAEAFRSERDEKGHELERLDRHTFCGLYPEVCGRREGYLVGGSWDSRVEMLLSVGMTYAVYDRFSRVRNTACDTPAPTNSCFA